MDSKETKPVPCFYCKSTKQIFHDVNSDAETCFTACRCSKSRTAEGKLYATPPCVIGRSVDVWNSMQLSTELWAGS